MAGIHKKQVRERDIGSDREKRKERVTEGCSFICMSVHILFQHNIVTHLFLQFLCPFQTLFRDSLNLLGQFL